MTKAYSILAVHIRVEVHNYVDDVQVCVASCEVERGDAETVEGEVDGEVGAQDDFDVVLVAFDNSVVKHKLSSLK